MDNTEPTMMIVKSGKRTIDKILGLDLDDGLGSIIGGLTPGHVKGNVEQLNDRTLKMTVTTWWLYPGIIRGLSTMSIDDINVFIASPDGTTICGMYTLRDENITKGLSFRPASSPLYQINASPDYVPLVTHTGAGNPVEEAFSIMVRTGGPLSEDLHDKVRGFEEKYNVDFSDLSTLVKLEEEPSDIDDRRIAY